MRPVTFSCTASLPLALEEIANQILDLANWTSFTGYGPLPGIKAAEFEARPPGVVGKRGRGAGGRSGPPPAGNRAEGSVVARNLPPMRGRTVDFAGYLQPLLPLTTAGQSGRIPDETRAFQPKSLVGSG